jgi:hypothetical protein
MRAFDSCRGASGESSAALPVRTALSRDTTDFKKKQCGATRPAMLEPEWRDDKMSGIPREMPRAMPHPPLALECDDLKTWLLESEPGHPSRRLVRQLSPQSVMDMLDMDSFEAIPEPLSPSRPAFPLVHGVTAYCHSRNEHWADGLVWPSLGATALGSCLPSLDADWTTAFYRLCLGPEL